MKFQLMDIEAYLAVVESGSISTAARRIGVAKSILSKRIVRLEQSLGAELLHRSTRGVAPADEGRTVRHEYQRRAHAGFSRSQGRQAR